MPARDLTPICAALSFTVLSALAPQTVAAQLIVLKPETKVRITAPSRHLDGNLARVVSQLGDSVTVRLAGDYSTMTLRGDEITMMEVANGRRSYPLKGTAIGLGVGALLGILGYEKPRCESGSYCYDPGPWAGGVLGAVVGLEVGFVVGSIVTGDRWESAPLRVYVSRPGVGQRAAAFRAGVSLGF